MSDTFEPAPEAPDAVPVEMPPVEAGPAPASDFLPAPVVSAPAQSGIEQTVAAWVMDCIHNSPIAQATEAFNHLITCALPELLRRLTGENA